MNRLLPQVAITVIAGLAALPACAATFCANSPATIQAALTQAASNSANDQVRIVGGTYPLTNALAFSSSESFALTISGGYNTGCTVFTGAPTILDGQQQRKPLSVFISNGNVGVDGLTFIRGLSTNNRGGGLQVYSNTGNIRIDRNTFYANRADDYAGALSAYTNSGTMRVRNNLAFANTSAYIGAMELVQNNNGEAYIVGNTIIANSSDDNQATGGIRVGGNAHFTLSNNILWQNAPEGAGPPASDFQSSATSHSRIANDIGVVANGTVADLVVGELSVDPQFADCEGFLCFNFELVRSSPLVDAGMDAPDGGMPSIDLAGKPRTIGAHVDIGAYENDLLFASGFE